MYLHKIFKPKKEYELTRLGKKNDGGYLVGIQTVKESQYLISFGTVSYTHLTLPTKASV